MSQGMLGNISLLVFDTTMISVPARTSRFVAREKFRLKKDGGIFSGFGDNFETWFLIDSAIEEPIGEQTLRSAKLRIRSADGPIIIEIGGKEVAITGLTHACSLAEQQPNGPNGEAGPLLTNGYVNIFYVPQAVTKLEGNSFSYVNKKGKTIIEQESNSDYLFEMNGRWYVLRAVDVYWRDDGWLVFAYAVSDPNEWVVGTQVFSRNPSVPVLAQV